MDIAEQICRRLEGKYGLTKLMVYRLNKYRDKLYCAAILREDELLYTPTACRIRGIFHSYLNLEIVAVGMTERKCIFEEWTETKNIFTAKQTERVVVFTNGTYYLIQTRFNEPPDWDFPWYVV